MLWSKICINLAFVFNSVFHSFIGWYYVAYFLILCSIVPMGGIVFHCLTLYCLFIISFQCLLHMYLYIITIFIVFPLFQCTFMQNLLKSGERKLAKSLNSTYRFFLLIILIFSINSINFIHPSECAIKETTDLSSAASYLDLYFFCFYFDDITQFCLIIAKY